MRVGEVLFTTFIGHAHRSGELFIQVILGAFSYLAVSDPVSFIARWGSRDFCALAIAHDFRPGVRLEPVHPGSTQFQWTAHALFGPGTAADAVFGFQDFILNSSGLQLTRCNQARESGADDDNFVFRHD